jgi:hypothetical protein
LTKQLGALGREVARLCMRGVVGGSENGSGSADGAWTAWVTAQQIPVDKVVTEVGSALNGTVARFLLCCVVRW